jgi:hypothetical protein
MLLDEAAMFRAYSGCPLLLTVEAKTISYGFDVCEGLHIGGAS